MKNDPVSGLNPLLQGSDQDRHFQRFFYGKDGDSFRILAQLLLSLAFSVA